MFDYRRLAARPSLIAILTALATVPAAAEDKDIDDDRTTKVTSVTEIGEERGTLTLTADGSVVVETGTAVEINGPHRFVATGNITSEDVRNGRGILFNSSAPNTRSSLSLSGDILVSKAGTDFDADKSRNVRGIELTGDGFIGDFSITSTGSVNVWGADGRGVLIDAPLKGDFTNRGVISVQGNRAIALDITKDVDGNIENWGAISARYADTYGIRALGEISGALVHGGSLQVGLGATLDDDGKAVPAEGAKAGIYVGNNVDGGIVFQGVGANNDLDLDGDDTDDITADSSINTTGGTAALIIENTRTDGTDQVIGLIDGENSLSFINRGNISVAGGSKRIAATGMIFGSSDAGAGKTVFEGGISFDRGTLAVGTLNADAVGIHLKGGVELPSLFNSGQIGVTTDRTITGTDEDNLVYGPGGDATAILISKNNSLPRVNNTGRILAGAAGEDSIATAILDKSGTITNLKNSGQIAAVADEGTAIALDLRANTVGTWIKNTGIITGNVLLGSGNDSLILDEGGSIEGDISFGTGNDRLQLLNDSVINGSIDYKGTLAFLVEDGDLTIGSEAVLNATTAEFAGESHISIEVDAENNKAGRINITNGIDIGDKVTVSPVLESFVREARSFDLITAGFIDFADAEASLELTDAPYLFDVELGATNNAVTLHLRPKTAEELGFNSQVSTLYSQILGYEDLDKSLETYVANLQTEAEVNSTFRKLLPDVSNDSYNMLLLSERRTGRLVSERLESVGTTRNDDGSLWGTQHFERLTAGDVGAALPGRITSTGITLGLDQSISDTWLLGVAAGFTLDQSDRNDNAGSEMSLFSPFLTGYALARYGKAHVALTSTLRYSDISRTRDLVLDVEERSIESDTSGLGISGSAEVGYDLVAGNFHFKPTALLRAIHYKESGYTEEGGLSAGYEVGKRTMDRVEGELGARLQYEFAWYTKNASVMRLVPEIRATYAKAVTGDEVSDLNARFENAEEGFVIQSDKLYDNLKSIGAGVALFGNGATGRINYDYRDYGTLTGHSAMLTVSLSF